MAVIEKTPVESTSAKYVDFDEFIDHQLRKTRSGIHQTDLLSAGVVLLCLLSAYLLVFALFDQWIIPNGFSMSARIFLLGTVGVLAGIWIGWRILYPWLQSINALYAARQIEQAHPELKGSLLTWVNFRQTGREVSPSVLSALEKRTAHQIEHANVEQAVDRQGLMRASYFLLGLVIAICLYTLASPKKMSTTLWRALLPASTVSAATRTEIRDVRPGDTEVLARDQVDVIAELGGQIPPEVTLRFSTVDRRFVNEPIRMQRTTDELPRFQGRLTGDAGKGLLSDVSYFIEAGDARSPTYQIRVNQPPSAEAVELVYEYPRYMGLTESSQSGSTIEAWEGTFVTVRARSNMPVKKAVIYCSDTQTAVAGAEEYPMVIQDDALTARWQLKFRDDGTFARYYHIQVWNERNQKNPHPTIHRIQIRPDLKPEVRLVSPAKDQNVPANAQVPVAFAARDPDFLLRRVSLKIQHNGELLPYPPPLFAAPPEMAEFKSIYRFDLARLPLKAGDQLTLWMEAEDNFEPFGKRVKNVSRSPQVTLTVTEPVAPEQLKAEQQKQDEQLQQNIEQAPPSDQPVPPQQPEDPQPRQPRPNEQNGDNPQQDPQQNRGANQPQMEQGQQGENAPQQGQPQQGGGQQGAGQQGAGQGTPGQGDPQPGSPQSQPNPGNSSTAEQPADSSSQEGTGSPQPGGKQSTSSGNEPGKSSAPGTPPAQPGASSQESSQPDSSSTPRKDKAAEDQALDRLLKWNREQQQQGKQKNSPMNGESPPPAAQGEKSPSDSATNSSQQSPGNSMSPKDNPDGSSASSSSSPAKPNPANGSAGERPQPDQSGKPSSPGNDPAGDAPDRPGSQPSEPMPGDNEKNSKQIPREESVPRGENPSNSKMQPSSGPQNAQDETNSSQAGENSAAPSGDSQPDQKAGNDANKPGQSTGMKNPGGESASPAEDQSDRPNSPSNPTGSKEASQKDAPQGEKASETGSSQEGAASQQSSSGSSSDSAEAKENNQKGDNGTGMKSPPAPGEKPAETSPDASKSPSGNETLSGQSEPAEDRQSPTGKPNGSSEQMPQRPDNSAPPSGSSQQNEAEKPGQPSQKSASPDKNAKGQSAPAESGSERSPSSPSGMKREAKGAGTEEGASPQESQSSPGGDPGKSGNPNAPGKSASQGGNDSQPAMKNTPQNGAGKEDGQPGAGQQGTKQAEQGQDGTGQPQSGPPGNGQNAGQQHPGQKEMPGQNGAPGQEKQKQLGQPGADQPGDPQNGEQKNQQAGDSPNGMQKQNGNSPGENPSGSNSSSPEGKSGEVGGQPGRSSGGKPGPASEGGAPQSTSPGEGKGPLNRSAPAETAGQPKSGSEDQLTPEEADLANKRKATELALKRLRSQLERGETPRELMNELGYTEQDLERFMQRLEQRLSDPGLDHSPESEAARRQFDSILKGIDYRSSGQQRRGGTQEREASQSAGSGNRLAPPQYRRDSEAYKEKLSRDGTER